MSSRDHECSICHKEWHCDGCETQEIIKVCDDCIKKKKSYATLCLERAEKAHKELCAVCANKNKFMMSIPPQHYDTDMIIQSTIDDCNELARRLNKACELLIKLHNKDPFFAFLYNDIKELEAPLEGK